MENNPCEEILCSECQGTGRDKTAEALEKLGAVLPLRCAKCNGSGMVIEEFK